MEATHTQPTTGLLPFFFFLSSLMAAEKPREEGAGRAATMVRWPRPQYESARGKRAAGSGGGKLCQCAGGQTMTDSSNPTKTNCAMNTTGKPRGQRTQAVGFHESANWKAQQSCNWRRALPLALTHQSFFGT